MEFPAVTICAPGWSKTYLNAGFYNLFLKYMQEKTNFSDNMKGLDVEYYLSNNTVGSFDLADKTDN